jgi:hypothetical protein
MSAPAKSRLIARYFHNFDSSVNDRHPLIADFPFDFFMVASALGRYAL